MPKHKYDAELYKLKENRDEAGFFANQDYERNKIELEGKNLFTKGDLDEQESHLNEAWTVRCVVWFGIGVFVTYLLMHFG